MADNQIKVIITALTDQAEAAIKSFGESVDSTSKSLFNATNIANTLGGALTSAAIVAGIKSSIEAASQYQAALLGLASVARYAGEDVSKTLTTATSLSSDGLLSTTESATALKNLLSRGFTTEQAVEMIGRFKDSAAFGRQASLQFGEAVVSATEGIKNENSILVDNAGVTKNVSVMWKEYAAAHGVTVDALTQAQKRQAEYNGILKETEGLAGNAALAANTLAGATARLNKATTDASVAMGEALTPVATDLTNMFTWLVENGIKPFVGGIKIMAVEFAYSMSAIGLSIEYATSPSKWGKSGTAEFEARMKEFSRIAEEEKINIANSMTFVQTPNIGKDSGARRADVVLPVKDPNASAISSIQEEAFRKQMEAMGVAAAQVKVYELAMKGATDEQLREAQASASQTIAAEAHIKAEKDRASALTKTHAALVEIDKMNQATLATLIDLDLQEQLRQANLLTGSEMRIAVADVELQMAENNAKRQRDTQLTALKNKHDDLQKNHALTLELEQKFGEQRVLVELEYQMRITEAEKRSADAKMQSDFQIVQFSQALRKNDFVNAMGIAEQMSAGLAGKSRAMFEINKAASLAKATVSGYQMITAAAADGSSWGGYWGGIAEGVLAAAYVATQLDAINSTQFGGGGGGISGGSGGGGSIPSMATSPGIPVSQQPVVQQQQPVTVNIYNTGNVLSKDYIESTVIPQIKDSVTNSDVLIIDPRSRQAQVLGAA